MICTLIIIDQNFTMLNRLIALVTTLTMQKIVGCYANIVVMDVEQSSFYIVCFK